MKYHIGERTIEVEDKCCAYLVDLIDNPHPLTRSVYIHRDGTVNIEEYDGKFSNSYRGVDDFETVIRPYVAEKIAEFIPQLYHAGFFDDRGVKRINLGEVVITYYTNPYFSHFDEIVEVGI